MGNRHLKQYNAYNFDRNADWTRTLTQHATYVATHPGASLSPWAAVHGWTLQANLFDIMHLLYLGVLEEFCGSALFSMALDISLGTTALLNSALRGLWHECKNWCREHHIRHTIKKFSTSLLGWEDASTFPSLEHRVKAANIKTTFMWVCAKLKSDSATPDELLMSNCALAMKRFIQITDRADLFLTEVEAQDASDSGYAFLQLYARLAESKRLPLDAQRLWKLIPKHHYLAHLCLEIVRTRLNPRRHDCFVAEDFMGKVKASVEGCGANNAGRTFIDRYIRFLAHRWHRD